MTSRKAAQPQTPIAPNIRLISLLLPDINTCSFNSTLLGLLLPVFGRLSSLTNFKMDDYNTVFERSDVDSAQSTDIPQSQILLNNLDFPLDEVISGCQPTYATLTLCCQDESIIDLGLALNNFWHKSSLLANWFEETRSGYKCYLENIDPVPFVCFLRYIYLDDYEPNWSPSISLMVRVLHYAELYDTPELAFDLQHDIETVLGHYSLQPPYEFFDAVRFIHDKLPSNIQVRKAVAEYCVSNFQLQELVEHTEFMESLHEVRSFLRDVCAANIQKGFQDEGEFANFSVENRTCN